VIVEVYLFIFLVVKLGSLGEVTRQKESINLKGKQSLRAADRCLMRVPSIIKLKLLENMHAMICESRVLYGVWKRDRMLLINFRRFCNSHKKPKEHSKREAEWELGRESRKGMMLCGVVKYWYRTLLVEKDELLKCSYEW